MKLPNNSSIIDLSLGIATLIMAVYIVFEHILNSDSLAIQNKGDFYTVCANFNDISGILVGTKVKISGIDVGYVSGHSLNEKNYSAKVQLSIKKDISIPKESIATISSDHLIDAKHVKIIPSGNYGEILPRSGEAIIKHTQSSITLESIIDSFIKK